MNKYVVLLLGCMAITQRGFASDNEHHYERDNRSSDEGGDSRRRDNRERDANDHGSFSDDEGRRQTSSSLSSPPPTVLSMPSYSSSSSSSSTSSLKSVFALPLPNPAPHYNSGNRRDRRDPQHDALSRRVAILENLGVFDRAHVVDMETKSASAREARAKQRPTCYTLPLRNLTWQDNLFPVLFAGAMGAWAAYNDPSAIPVIPYSIATHVTKHALGTIALCAAFRDPKNIISTRPDGAIETQPLNQPSSYYKSWARSLGMYTTSYALGYAGSSIFRRLPDLTQALGAEKTTLLLLAAGGVGFLSYNTSTPKSRTQTK